MRKMRMKLAIGVAAVGVAAMTAAAVAGDHGRLKTTLNGYEETPKAISTDGNGTLQLKIARGGEAIEYELRYDDLEGGAVRQAHIHFGQQATSGDVSAFLCTNMDNGPAGTQACPPPPARITGTITADQVVGPEMQGIAPGELDELISAIRAGFAYGNVHTETYPAGEIRGQFDGDDDDRGRDRDHDR